jgi:hypothetical protein
VEGCSSCCCSPAASKAILQANLHQPAGCKTYRCMNGPASATSSWRGSSCCWTHNPWHNYYLVLTKPGIELWRRKHGDSARSARPKPGINCCRMLILMCCAEQQEGSPQY